MQARAPARFAALLVGAYIGIGLPIGAIGVAWPQIRDTFDRPLSALGLLLITFTVGNLAASVAHGRIAHRVGTGRLLVASELAGLVGLTLFAATPVWAGLLVAMTLLGVAVAGLDAELNSYVAVHHGPRLLHLMHGGFGIGATLGPLAVAVLLGTDLSWRLVYMGMAVLWLVVAVLFVVRRHRWAPPPRVMVDARGVEQLSEPAMSRTLAISLVLGLALFFVYAGVEMGAGSWGFTLLTGDGTADGTAGFVVTAYWAALTAGRLVLGVVGHRVRPTVVVHVSIVAMVVASALMLFGGAAAAAALVLLGLAQAGVFPSLVALTPARLGRRRAHRIMGLQFAAANTGGALLPALMGVAAERSGEDTIAVAVFVMAVTMAVLHGFFTVRSGRVDLTTAAQPVTAGAL
jgi:fucose permease